MSSAGRYVLVVISQESSQEYVSSISLNLYALQIYHVKFPTRLNVPRMKVFWFTVLCIQVIWHTFMSLTKFSRCTLWRLLPNLADGRIVNLRVMYIDSSFLFTSKEFSLFDLQNAESLWYEHPMHHVVKRSHRMLYLPQTLQCRQASSITSFQ